LDSLNVYSKKTYYGAKFHILINNLNSDLLPTRGIYWNTDFTALRGAGSTNHYTRLTSDMTLYSSFSEPSGLVFVTRVGGGRIYSKDYQYFQALTLGSNNFLRGFRKNRFAGDALFYSGLEVRLKLFNSKSFVLPGSVGLLGFGEVGRVWLRNEESRKWHDSYGGGLYYAAFNVALFSATMGFSREEKTFNFSVGSKFNITF
jgi:outer membrane protein assembly factor BamA